MFLFMAGLYDAFSKKAYVASIPAFLLGIKIDRGKK